MSENAQEQPTPQTGIITVSGIEIERTAERLTLRFSGRRSASLTLLWAAGTLGSVAITWILWEQGYRRYPLIAAAFVLLCLGMACSAAVGHARGFTLDKRDGNYRRAGDPVCRLDAIRQVRARTRLVDTGRGTRTVHEVVLVNPAGKFDTGFLPVQPSEAFTYRSLDEAYAVAEQIAAFLGAEAVRADERKKG